MFINTHKLLQESGYSSKTCDYPTVAKEAAKLARKPGATPETVMSQIRQKFPLRELPTLRPTPGKFEVWGTVGVDFDYATIEQMRVVARLPVYAAGALMPDAHLGYALPIGGVAALHEAVSPNGVGVDIACRMAMSILPITPEDAIENKKQLLDVLLEETRFGRAVFDKPRSHPVMQDPAWQDKSLPLHEHYQRAQAQLGTSGGGNHFVDIMLGTIEREVDWLPFELGETFVAVLSHSGSRGIGALMARHYSQLAQKETAAKANGIPRDLAWLDINTDQGREYLAVMQLMGRYAQANHHLIHAHIAKRLGVTPISVAKGTAINLPDIAPPFTVIENHHNYAWREGEYVIHRKGATPAEAGVPGLIPGSSGSYSYLVEGLGNKKSLNSSSHGAGRPFSRSQAKELFDSAAFKEHMDKFDVLYHGIAPDEAVMAYKDIERVMELQQDLVSVVARMKPLVVVMGG